VEGGAMRQYELTFVVEGISPEDDAAVAVLAEELDATVALGAGVTLLVIAAEGSDAIDAARNAVLSVLFRVPSVRFLYLDRDLVGVSEIAERTGRSRQNVSQWVAAERHSDIAEPFPRPEGVVGRVRVWLWAEVNAWLRNLNLADEIPGPSRAEVTDIDYMLRHHQLLTLERPVAAPVYPSAYVGRSLPVDVFSLPPSLSFTCSYYWPNQGVLPGHKVPGEHERSTVQFYVGDTQHVGDSR
jgi:hypothetical protein